MTENYERVQKWIALSGYCGRKNAEKLIEKGHVQVNGKLITLGDHCYSTDRITINNQTITVPTNNFTYMVINKPKGVITSKADNQNRKKILDLIDKKDFKANLFPVGRLDMNTTGLLVITNDGVFAQSFLHPSSNTSKTYTVVVDREVTPEHKAEIEKGVQLEEVKLAPCKVKKTGDKEYQVIIHEGKNRQIRRMFFAFKYRVVKLKRTHIGKLSLEKLNLKLGEYKIVSKSFLQKTIKK